MKISKQFKYLCLILLLSSCARFAIRKPNSTEKYQSHINVTENFSKVRYRLKQFLKNRGQNFKEHMHRNGRTIDIEMEWVRDTSLNYYYVQRGTRKPHLSHWKGVWSISKISNSKTRIYFKTMELIYLGPQEEASSIPTNNGRWAESNSNNLRAALELRRFWNMHFKNKRLPSSLSQIKIPTLEFDPISSLNRKDRLYRATRPSAF